MAEIAWPAEFRPENTSVFASNEITIAAAPEVVWAWLIRAKTWPQWYSNAHHPVLGGGLGVDVGPNLEPGMVFRWETFGMQLASTVREFVPKERLAWDAKGKGIEAYHAWLLEPTEAGGTRVLTQETQKGWNARLRHLFMPKALGKAHQEWLVGLKQRAENGAPEKPVINVRV